MILASIIALQFTGGIQMPPPRYDHHHAMTVRWVDWPTLASVCHNLHAGACTTGGKACVVYINQGYRGTWAEPLYRRHEQAHCNGWPANHPGAR